jgi:predicted aspartyl protease
MKQATTKRRTGAKRRGTRKKVSTFKYRFEIAATPAGPFPAVEGLVDTGSLYTWIPRSDLAPLGFAPAERLRFLMANGEEILRDATEIVVRIDGRIRHTICVFGDDKDLTLLGAFTLEQFTLAVDSANERLIPMPAIPAATSQEGRKTWT